MFSLFKRRTAGEATSPSSATSPSATSPSAAASPPAAAPPAPAAAAGTGLAVFTGLPPPDTLREDADAASARTSSDAAAAAAAAAAAHADAADTTGPSATTAAAAAAAAGPSDTTAAEPVFVPTDPPVQCTHCVARVAYAHCESCDDSFCSACWAALHRGRLAAHAAYFIDQPAGWVADADIRGVAPEPEVGEAALAGARATVGAALRRSIISSHTRGAPAVAEDVRDRRAAQRLTLATTAHGEALDAALVRIGDVGRYVARARRTGRLPIPLQQSVSLMPREAVDAAAWALTDVEAAKEVGGWAAVKNRPLDPWVAGVRVEGAGLVAWK